MFSNSPTLRVTLNESNVFTNPSINSAEEPSDDPIFSGTITLNLRKRRAIKVIKVLLEGNSCIYGGSAFKIQYRPTLRKEVSIDFKNEFLESGEHQFKFSFIIPSNTQPSQTCAGAKVDHSIVGTVEFSGGITKSSILSPPVNFNIIQNPSARIDLLESLNSVVFSHSSDLGPVNITFTSPRLSVSSLVHAMINISSPPSDVNIISIQPFMNESFLLYYPNECKVKPPTQFSPLPIYSQSNETLKKKSILLRGGKEWNHNLVVRLPDDKSMRPSTLSHTNCVVEVKHKFSVVIRYQVVGKGEKEAFMLIKSSHVIVGSCKVPNDSILLPTYSRVLARTISGSSTTSTNSTKSSTSRFSSSKNSSKNKNKKCKCSETYEDLIESCELNLGYRRGSINSIDSDDSVDSVVSSSRMEKSPAMLC